MKCARMSSDMLVSGTVIFADGTPSTTFLNIESLKFCNPTGILKSKSTNCRNAPARSYAKYTQN